MREHGPSQLSRIALAALILILGAALATPAAEGQSASPGPGRTHYQLGLEAFQRHNWAEAVRQLSWTLEYMPKSPAVHNALGLACLADGKVDRAAVEFRRAIALKPDFAEAYDNMAQALERRDDEIGAAQFYAWAISSGLPKAESEDARGFILDQRGDLQGAESEYEDALRDNPSLAVAHFHLGMAFCQQKRYSQAAAELKEAIALDPSNAKAKDYLGLASRRLNQTEESPPGAPR